MCIPRPSKGVKFQPPGSVFGGFFGAQISDPTGGLRYALLPESLVASYWSYLDVGVWARHLMEWCLSTPFCRFEKDTFLESQQTQQKTQNFFQMFFLFEIFPFKQMNAPIFSEISNFQTASLVCPPILGVFHHRRSMRWMISGVIVHKRDATVPSPDEVGRRDGCWWWKKSAKNHLGCPKCWGFIPSRP